MNPLAWYEVGNQLTTRILRSARSVYQCLGPGCCENDYRKGLINDLQRQNLEIQRLFPVDVWQSGELAELYFLDLFVEWQVIVKIFVSHKSFTEHEREEMCATLEASGAELGMLLNFGGRGGLEYERVFPRERMP
jgi:GxxExxY protein